MNASSNNILGHARGVCYKCGKPAENAGAVQCNACFKEKKNAQAKERRLRTGEDTTWNPGFNTALEFTDWVLTQLPRKTREWQVSSRVKYGRLWYLCTATYRNEKLKAPTLDVKTVAFHEWRKLNPDARVSKMLASRNNQNPEVRAAKNKAAREAYKTRSQQCYKNNS